MIQEASIMAGMEVYMFLSWCYSEYDKVCGKIRHKEICFDSEQRYAYVRKVQSNRQVMGHFIESSTMVVQHRPSHPRGFSSLWPCHSLQPIWIINISTSDHMTNDPSFLKKLSSSSQSLVSIVNDTLILVTRKVSIGLFDILIIIFYLWFKSFWILV